MKEKCIHSLSIMILLLSLLMCYGEVFSFFFEKMNEVTVVHTPFWVKGVKDVGFVLLTLLSIICFKYNKRRIKGLMVYFLCIFFFFAVSFFNNKYFAASGLRWVLPFTASLLIYPYINRSFLVKISYSLIIIFCFHFLVQLIQVYFYYNIHAIDTKPGSMSHYFLGRAPGIFFMPNTASFFTVLTWFFCGQFILDKNISKLKYLIPISILLNKSGAGYVTFFCVVILEHLPKITWKIVVGSTILSVILLLILEHLLNRPDLILISLGERMAIFARSFLSAELISTRFGYGSITAVLLARNFHISDPVPILDSTWSALSVNLGIIPLIIIMILMAYAAWLSHKTNRMDILTFLFILFCFGTTNSLFEAFPMNFLWPVLGVYYIKQLRYNQVLLKQPEGTVSYVPDGGVGYS